jgi:hypothetical protein
MVDQRLDMPWFDQFSEEGPFLCELGGSFPDDFLLASQRSLEAANDRRGPGIYQEIVPTLVQRGDTCGKRTLANFVENGIV